MFNFKNRKQKNILYFVLDRILHKKKHIVSTTRMFELKCFQVRRCHILRET